MLARCNRSETTTATRRNASPAPREAFARYGERSALRAANDNFAHKRATNDNAPQMSRNAMNAHERLPSVHRAFKWQNYAYDANGNTTREFNENNLTLRSYKYDMEGRLLQMTDPRVTGGYTVRFHYDGLGRRILQKTTTNGVTTYKRYLWCGQTLCQQRDTGTAQLRRYLATGEYVNAIGGTPAKKYVYFQDHLGSVRDLVDATTGARIGALDYKPYGAIKATDGIQPDYQYAGLLWVPEVGLNASATRFYDPGTTRWMTADWIGELGGINLYAYNGGNPIMRVDPMGTFGMMPNIVPTINLCIPRFLTDAVAGFLSGSAFGYAGAGPAGAQWFGASFAAGNAVSAIGSDYPVVGETAGNFLQAVGGARTGVGGFIREAIPGLVAGPAKGATADTKAPDNVPVSAAITGMTSAAGAMYFSKTPQEAGKVGLFAVLGEVANTYLKNKLAERYGCQCKK